MNELKTEIKDYGKKPVFSSFLPGIAGIRGIPLWCFYVNRGQGVVSFGVENKDHPIMEFYPAHTAYRRVKTVGFRTFIRRDGVFFEPFADENAGQEMCIEMNGLRIREENKTQNVRTDVSYFILPEERIAALIRMVTITNTGENESLFEIADGMPALIPYGISDGSLKNMTQTAKAWMQAEDVQSRIPYFRVRASMEDSATITEVKGGCFSMAIRENGEKCPVLVDPDVLFSYDTALERPVTFIQGGLAAVEAESEVYSNQMPCSFFTAHKRLKPGESAVFCELFGQVENRELLDTFLQKDLTVEWFHAKKQRAEKLARELTDVIDTKTGDDRFDAYCRYTYMDNVLRGGFPIRLPGGRIFWVYSRKHGDLERDYNYFSMLPEFYSQGNGNFRDVNQNRRCDTFFAPYVGRSNIDTFYSLIQLDGYNPLGVEKITYYIEKKQADLLTADLAEQYGNRTAEAVARILEGPFTPGQLALCLQDAEPSAAETLFARILSTSEERVNGDFKEGYWCDHWTYNLDLVEEYLSLYPEKEAELLLSRQLTWYLSQAALLPRAKRYVETEKGLRQYRSIDEASLRNPVDKRVRTEYGSGEILRSSLLEKLLVLCAVKYATLDPYGMGIEMEGGKPGWYDALNGMPGLFGSSMAETYELARMLDYTIGALERLQKTKGTDAVTLFEEAADLLADLAHMDAGTAAPVGNTVNDKDGAGDKDTVSDKDTADTLTLWNLRSDIREAYRANTYSGVSGRTRTLTCAQLTAILQGYLDTVNSGIARALTYGDGICPTYFTYEADSYRREADGIHPTNFAVKTVPYFLEGPVRYLKLNRTEAEKRALYEQVKDSDLYDRKLSMYKVNASLAEGSYELGRCKAFTPGWLENESIWLHMEYKYLLELLKCGLYEEFAQDLHAALIPFQSEERYGRSTLENSSFLASSRNPDARTHGRGFVARLSGSTIEFISIWKLMMFGSKPFIMEDGQLKAQLLPTIPAYLIGEDRIIRAMFMGHTVVEYHLHEKKDYIPGEYRITAITTDGERIEGQTLIGEMAEKLRAGAYRTVRIDLQ